MNCKNCNTTLEYGEKTCPNCGTRNIVNRRSTSDSVTSGVAFLVTLIRTLFFIYAVGMAIFASKGQYAGLVWSVVLIGFVMIALLWVSVIFASESKGWAVLLLILGIFDIFSGFKGNLIVLISGIVYLVYAFKCLND